MGVGEYVGIPLTSVLAGVGFSVGETSLSEGLVVGETSPDGFEVGTISPVGLLVTGGDVGRGIFVTGGIADVGISVER